MPAEISTDVDVLVIGGGAIGASIAFHLARTGTKRVQLIERYRLSEGTTWHSAGMVGQLRPKAAIMQVISRSAALYDRIEHDHPGLIDFRRTGSLRLASTEERMAEMTQQAAHARSLGVDVSMIDTQEISRLLPTLNVSDLVGACWIPTDGYVDPEKLAVGLGSLAAQAGGNVVENVGVTALSRTGDRWTVHTDSGEVTATDVVIAAGMYSTTVAGMADVFVPIVCSRQQLVSSAPIDPAVAHYPTLREPDLAMIMRPKGDALVIGSYAEDPEIELVGDVEPRPRYLFEPEFDRMAPVWEAACHRFPQIAAAGDELTIKGPEGVTPDGELILGPTGRDGLWLAAGGSGHGIASAGGVGWIISSWLTTGTPPIDVDDFSLMRFPTSYATDAAAMLSAARQSEIGHYAMVETTS